MIRSAVRTTLRSLLRSDLVAELNQTVIDVQRMDSMMAEYTFSAGEGSRASAGLFFLHRSRCDCLTSSPGRWCCSGI